jgi:hypothetical protein
MRRVPCIISYAGVSSDETFLKTIQIETGFWKDSVLKGRIQNLGEVFWRKFDEVGNSAGH